MHPFRFVIYQEIASNSLPAQELLGIILHSDALRLLALREGCRIKETLATENEREIPIRTPAHVHSAHTALAVGAKLTAHSQPVLRTGLMAPAWRSAL